MNVTSKLEQLQELAKETFSDKTSLETFNRFTSLTALLLDAPVTLLSLAEGEQLYFKSAYGLPASWIEKGSIPLARSLSQTMLISHQPVIVENIYNEPIFGKDLAMADKDINLVACLGFPLDFRGVTLGSLSVLDKKPRLWTARDIHVVKELAYCVATEIALRIEGLERQQITKQLQASEERFRTLANQAPIMIWQTDAIGAATFFNATWCTFTGYEEQEGLTLGWLSVVHPDDRTRIFEDQKKAIKQRLPFKHEFRHQRADGSYREVIAEGTPYVHPGTEEISYIGTTIDVTERNELERQRTILLSLITHELKTPLTGLHMANQMAQRRLDTVLNGPHHLSEDQQHALLMQSMAYLNWSQERVQMQNRMINDLLDLSRVQTGKLSMHFEATDLQMVVQECIQEQQMISSKRRIKRKGAQLKKTIVFADGQRVKQVLWNYMMNALKYSPEEEPIEVGICEKEMGWYVWVRDHGVGLSPEQQMHVWEQFYQTREIEGSAEASPGLGLGLAICQTLIHEQCGTVGVKSVKGEGSTFWFTLPRHIEP